MEDLFHDFATAFIQWVQQSVNTAIIRSFVLNVRGYSHMQKLYLVVSWVSYVGEECQIASAATTSIAGKRRGQLCREHFDPWPQPNFFIQHYSKIITHICF